VEPVRRRRVIIVLATVIVAGVMYHMCYPPKKAAVSEVVVNNVSSNPVIGVKPVNNGNSINTPTGASHTVDTNVDGEAGINSANHIWMPW
jgi:uncharacterized protein involved in exopolysaccharide biosynthesis